MEGSLEKAWEEGVRKIGLDQKAHGNWNPHKFPPKNDPEWDLNQTAGEIHKNYIRKLFYWDSKRKWRNWNTLTSCMNGRGSKAFYERWCEVAPKWMGSDPAREGSRMLFNRLFVGKLAPAFRKKLQNREEVEGMVVSQVMPVRIGKR